MHKKFDHKEIEKKWQDKWREIGIYKTDDNSSKPKMYVLDMFPYPSGNGLHVGHPKGYIATDVYARYKRMNGYNVLHPMGWDAFGLPAEQYAIKNKVHPRDAVEKNTKRFKEQLEIIGFDYDWEREVNTTDPEYYKWTQWIFLNLFEKGLAYESYEPINWCPSCQTGLANEDLEAGRCERCDSEIEKRPMRQWVLRITDYADRMLEDLALLPKWPDSVKEMQRNWIGKSDGAEISFTLSTNDEFKVFTTRPDTLFGATYVVFAPEHSLIAQNKDKILNWEEVEGYINESKRKAEKDRLDASKEKTGVKLDGITVKNPINGEELPVFIADYVLSDYGTGVIMAVPAHDKRDWEFANKFGVKIRQVIGTRGTVAGEVIFDTDGLALGKTQEFSDEWNDSYSNTGKLVNSNGFDGMSSEQAGVEITKKVGGEMTSTYRLQDWVFSRQRYWGEPIPLIHCDSCGVVPVPESELPVVLPKVEHYEPTGTGESPLAAIEEWVNTTCPKCGGAGKRETNTMPQWAGSSWYYLRYMDPKNNEALVGKDAEKYWGQVDTYVGGMEHAARHLIYARFWHKFLYDIGVVSTKEPFERLYTVGLIQAEDGRKMSKRWGNVINPDLVVNQNGADALRVYEMFMGPFENAIAWNTDSLVGAQRFVERSYGLNEHVVENESREVTKLLHRTIKKVSDDIETFKFNTAISALMIYLNEAEKSGLSKESYFVFLQLLAPFAPHLSEELWSISGQNNSIHTTQWPSYDENLLVDETVTISVQINGKMKGTVEVLSNSAEDTVMQAIQADEQLKSKIPSEVSKVIFVKNRIINLIGTG